MIENKLSKEQITNIDAKAPLIGAIYETGGHMSIQVSHARKRLKSGGVGIYPTVRPIMSHTDTHEAKVRRLASLFGGSVIDLKNANSWRWEVRGEIALYIADSIKNYTPSRKRETDFFAEVDDALDTQEKLVITKNFQNSDPNEYSLPTVDEYLRLLSNPLFQTGIFIGRGFLYYPIRRSGLRESEIPDVVIDTNRVPLLEAMEGKCGGSFEYVDDLPRRIRIRKREARRFLAIITPYLINSLSDYNAI